MEDAMNRNYMLHAFAVLLILLAGVACVLPGQAAAPAPTTNPITIESAVAGTALAAAQQTEQAKPVSVTETIVPADTPVAPEVISTFGTSLVKQGDGSIRFRDYRAGVQILFPPNWLPLRVGELEYYEASEKVGTQNPWFLEEIGWIQSLDVNVFRVNAYDTHPEHIFNDVLPKINVVFRQGDTRTLEQAEADEETLIERSVQEGHKFLSSDYQTISGSLQVLVFQSQWNAISYPTTHYKGTFFRVPAGLMVIDFYVPSELTETLEPEHSQIVESITLFDP
jgi:hypothetical protein